MTDQIPAAIITVPFDQFIVASIISWIEANGYKPHLRILSCYPGVRLPQFLMKEEMPVINAHTDATHKMQWHDDRVEFNARFSGKDERLVVPYRAIRAVGFAHTATASALPWINDPVPAASLSEEPVFQQIGEALVGGAQVQPEVAPEPVVAEVVSVPETTEEAPKSNVRTVDFRAPRKPKP